MTLSWLMKGCTSIWLQTSGSLVTAQASSSILAVKLATPTCLAKPSFLAWHSAPTEVLNGMSLLFQWISRRST